MSKVTNLATYPPESLQSYILGSATEILPGTVTACLWTDLEELDKLSLWLARWNGKPLH